MFIVIEGIHFPHYETPGGKMVAKYLRGEFGKLNEVTPEFAALLYSIDRYWLKDNLNETLKTKTILSDRYAESNLGFQGAKFEGKEREDIIEWMKNIDSRLPQPDLIVFLDLPSEAAMHLSHEKESPQAPGGGRDYLKGKSHDLHEESKTYQEKVREVYLQVAEKDGWNIIKCGEQDENGNWKIKTIEDIHNEIWDKVKTLI